MTPSHPAQPAKQKVSPEQCKHPQVQIVSRDEDSEYVECKECGEIITDDQDFREGVDDPDLCELCQKEVSDV